MSSSSTDSTAPGSAETETQVSGPGRSGLLDATTLTFLALIACPLLAFVCAAMGLILVVRGNTLAGLVFLVVLTQVFAVGGLLPFMRRRRDRTGR